MSRDGHSNTIPVDDVTIKLRDYDDPQGLTLEEFFNVIDMEEVEQIDISFLHVSDTALSLDVYNYHGISARELASICKNEERPLAEKTLNSRANPL